MSIHGSLWNDKHSFQEHYLSRSPVKFQGHTGPKIDDLSPISAFLEGKSRFDSRMAMYGMTYIAYKNMREVHYYFSRLCIKFQGQTGRKVDVLDSSWARLLGQSQLLNPSDLPCLQPARRINVRFGSWHETFDYFQIVLIGFNFWCKEHRPSLFNTFNPLNFVNALTKYIIIP